MIMNLDKAFGDKECVSGGIIDGTNCTRIKKSDLPGFNDNDKNCVSGKKILVLSK